MSDFVPPAEGYEYKVSLWSRLTESMHEINFGFNRKGAVEYYKDAKKEIWAESVRLMRRPYAEWTEVRFPL